MLSQFFVLSPRGDTIINKQSELKHRVRCFAFVLQQDTSRSFARHANVAVRSDVSKGSSEDFYHAVKFWKGGEPPPVFQLEDVTFAFVKRSNLYFVATTKFNVSPATTIEVLQRIVGVCKDYCGILSEEAIRKNFVLIYELLDEMLDFGYPQATSTEALKMYVHNTPIMVAPVPSASRFSLRKPTTVPHSAVNRSTTDSKKNEIYVDILERISVLINSSGYVLNSTVDGAIVMKSFLSGNPPLRMALNPDLLIGKEAAKHAHGGQVCLDDAVFHDCVNLSEFETGRVLSLVPPDGEFNVMTYRVAGEFRAPFRVQPYLETISPTRVDFVLKVRADIPASSAGSHIVVRFPVPSAAATVNPVVTGGPGIASARRGAASGASSGAGSSSSKKEGTQVAEYDAKGKRVSWLIEKLQGGMEATLRTHITLSKPSGNSATRKELGPVALQFEVPMYNVSQLQVKYLRISETAAAYKPQRWVRYVTQSSSYVVRL